MNLTGSLALIIIYYKVFRLFHRDIPTIDHGKCRYACKSLQLPFIDAGLGYGARVYVPDEFFVIEGNEGVPGLAGCEKPFVVIPDSCAEYGF